METTMEVPTGKIGRIIGAKGVTLQNVQQKYRVRVKVPPKHDQGPQSTHIHIKGEDVEGARAEIQSIIQGGPSGYNGGPGGQGGRGGAGMAGGMTGLVYMFRMADDTHELQLLLENPNGSWDVPKDSLNQMGDEIRDYEAGVERIIQTKLGGGDPSPPLADLHPVATIPAASKRIKPILVPQGWQGWFPVPVGQQRVSTEPCLVNGMRFEAVSNFAWADVGHVLADLQSMSKDVQLFFRKYGGDVEQAARDLYGPTLQLTQRQAQGRDPMTLLGKFYSLVQQLAAMPPQQFQEAVQASMDENALSTVTRRWESKFGDLPIP